MRRAEEGRGEEVTKTLDDLLFEAEVEKEVLHAVSKMPAATACSLLLKLALKIRRECGLPGIELLDSALPVPKPLDPEPVAPAEVEQEEVEQENGTRAYIRAA